MNKTMILILVSTIGNVSAFADSNLLCSNSTKNNKAEVTLKYPAGTPGSVASVVVAGKPDAMNCVIPAIEPGPSGPDQIYPVAFCYDGVKDGGYSMSITAGGFAGITSANIFEKNIAGDKKVASLICHELKHTAQN